MHDRRTPTNLLDGQPWAAWGPRVDDRADLDRSSLLVTLVARLTGRPDAQVDEILAHSHSRGRYLLLKRLSVTGHAAVYAGVDRKLAREVAVKIHRDAQQHARQRAIFESQAMARLSKHPNIVQIHDVGEHVYQVSETECSTWLYSVFELGDCDLYRWCVKPYLASGRARDWTEIAARIVEAGYGLAHLHGAGYVHCDIKPANILIVDGTAKLADFGSLVSPGSTTEVARTAGFIAPEVDLYGPSHASDVFSLAVTLEVCLDLKLPYVALSGVRPEVPEVGPSVITLAIADRQLADRAERPPSRRPRLPGSVLELLDRSQDPRSSKRPSLEEFIHALTTAVDEAEKRKQRRRWIPAIVAGAIVTLGLGFSIGAARYRGTGSGAPTDAVLGALDPLTRAEIAARMGDGDEAMAAIYQLYDESERFYESDLAELADAVQHIAQSLEAAGQWADAMEALSFAARLYERAGRTDEAEAVRAAQQQLLNSDPYQNK